jgi:hypothetical protein
VAQALLKKGNLRKLLDVFRMLEDLEDAEGLVNCFKAVKGVVRFVSPLAPLLASQSSKPRSLPLSISLRQCAERAACGVSHCVCRCC